MRQLKELMLGEERRELAALRERLDELDEESVDRLAGDIAEALRRRKELGEESFRELVAALQAGTESAIQRSVTQDKSKLSTALFPIMGPAIRHYVVELFRSMAAELNKTIRDTTSVERIKWRFQARLAGKPYSEYVLLKTRSFIVEEVYLMQRDTGLLLLHAASDPADEADGEADLVSGMFTAIRSFVRDSFSQAGHNGGVNDHDGGDEEELDSFTFGEREVLIEVGPSLVLAAVVHGVPPASIRDALKRILENLHAELQGRLEHFSGDTVELEPSRPTLREALKENQADRDEGSGGGGMWRVWFALGLVVAGAVTWLFFSIREQNRWDRFENALRAEPGIVVTGVRDDGWWRHRRVMGLRDPLAAEPSELAGRFEIDLEKTAFEFDLMASLEPELMARRGAGAEEMRAAEHQGMLAQIESLRSAQAKAESAAAGREAQARRSLESLVRTMFSDVPRLNIEFTPDGIRFSGDLAEPGFTSVLTRLEPLKAFGKIDASGLSNDTGHRVAELLRQISSTKIPFQAGTLNGEDEQQMVKLVNFARQLEDVASASDRGFKFEVVAHPLIGTNREANRKIEESRARKVRDRLIAKGLAPERIATRLSEDLAKSGHGVSVVPVEDSGTND